MPRKPPKSLVPVVLILLGVAVLLSLIAAGIVYSLLGLAVDLSASNICAPNQQNDCFVNEHGIVDEAGNTVMVILPGSGFADAVSVVAATEWEDHPAPGANVVLERWEGDEIAYVRDVDTGRRHHTNEGPNRGDSIGSLLALLLIGSAITAKTVEWIRGY